MTTIIDELKTIAKSCKCEKEYTTKAKEFLTDAGLKLPLMSDGELRDIYRVEDNKREKKKGYEKYDNIIRPALEKIKDLQDIYYEAWIDLDENFNDMWRTVFRYIDDEDIIKACSCYLKKQDKFYCSVGYTDMLDSLIKDDSNVIMKYN